MKLLIVYDQESIGLIVSEVARHGGWETQYSSNALEAVAIVGQYQPDVLLIDQFMPEKNGIEVVAELREKGFHLPVIIFSGNITAIDPAEAERLKIAKILSKPISIKELRSSLQQVGGQV
jgi:CheY-like chemotaxis protein